MPLPPPPALPADASLFLDFDGTLVDIAERPDAVIVGEGLRALLAGLAAARPGRVALVSGRSIEGLDGLLAGCGGLVLAGSHGAEYRLLSGEIVGDGPPAALARIAGRLAAFAAQDPGLLVERKRLGVALHYRRAPGFAAEAARIGGELATEEGLVLQHGKMMVEVRGPGDKGAALRRMLADVPAMRGTRPFMLGDDVTDEDGFAAAAALGGAGVLVGDGHGRATAARYALADVAAVHGWLAGAT